MTSLPKVLLTPIITRALEEDLAHGGDLTTLATIAADKEATAEIRLRKAGVVAGTNVAALVFSLIDPQVEIERRLNDGDRGRAGDVLLRVSGPARSLLTAERTALNFLTMLSGTATLTAAYVEAVRWTKACIAATRKTLPGLRLLQKDAVRAGGGMTHRMSLSDAVMIKDNHIAAAGGIVEAIDAARLYAGHTVKVEIEVDRLDQLQIALTARPDIVLLDNMDEATLREAVRLNDGRAVLEASGGVTLESVPGIADTGVDVISVGALTHSAPALDIGLDFDA